MNLNRSLLLALLVLCFAEAAIALPPEAQGKVTTSDPSKPLPPSAPVSEEGFNPFDSLASTKNTFNQVEGSMVQMAFPSLLSLAERGEFHVLEELFKEWRSPSQRLLDGRRKLPALLSWSQQVYTPRTRSDQYQMIQKWKAAYPKSALAALTEASYWHQRAWDARGYGYADTVSKEGWKLFRDRLAQAEKILKDTRAFSGNNALWYDLYLTLARDQEWAPDKLSALFNEAIGNDPAYLDHYFGMTVQLLPKWGGSLELVDKFISWSAERVEPMDRQSLYTRLYWAVSQHHPNTSNLFEETPASWKKMKAGFDNLLTQYPKSRWNLNAYASFACMAGDRETFITLWNKIGKQPNRDAWHYAWPPELCVRRFFEKS